MKRSEAVHPQWHDFYSDSRDLKVSWLIARFRLLQHRVIAFDKKEQNRESQLIMFKAAKVTVHMNDNNKPSKDINRNIICPNVSTSISPPFAFHSKTPARARACGPSCTRTPRGPRRSRTPCPRRGRLQSPRTAPTFLLSPCNSRRRPTLHWYLVVKVVSSRVVRRVTRSKLCHFQCIGSKLMHRTTQKLQFDDQNRQFGF